MIAAGLMLVPTLGTAQDVWPQWRGPFGTGVATSRTAPVEWNPTDGIRWSTELEGYGTSSPVVWNNRVFLTAQIGSGPVDERGAQFPDTRPAPRTPAAGRRPTLLVQAFDLTDGALVWDHRMAAEPPIPAVHRNHNFATPSVVTDGTRLVAWFGTGQIVALDLDGAPLWSRHLGVEYGAFDVLWGHGSSPALHDDLVILQVDHPPGAYLLALDARSGEERWHVDRGRGLRAYSTPLVVTRQGRAELIVNSSHRVDAYDPRTGEALWHAGGQVPVAVGMAVHADDTLFTSRGYSSSPYLAIRGSGDIVWTHPTRAPYISSLLLHEALLYMATEAGVLTVTDTRDGAIVHRERLGGVFAASPVSAGGHIYFLNETGEMVVLTPGPEPRVVARNALDERTLASPAVVDGRILIRTDRHLFCIGE